MSRQITISLEILRDLIFEFNYLSEIRCQSVTDAGPETYFPKIIPKELGKVIESLNTDDLFVIFHYDHHSEIWHKAHWQDSNSRRWSLIKASQISIEVFNERQQIEDTRRTKLHAIKECIIKTMPAFNDKAMSDTLHNMAVALSKSPKELAEKVPGLVDILFPSDDSQTK